VQVLQITRDAETGQDKMTILGEEDAMTDTFDEDGLVQL
jgi:hypothetical protein